MGQKYKIFVNNKTVYLVENPATVPELISGDSHFIIQPFKTPKALRRILEILLGSDNDSNLILYHSDVEKLREEFFRNFKVIEAAGGVVCNDKDELLLIHRKGFWDLPKGKMEGSETLQEAALREVKEETGISNADILSEVTFEGLSNRATYHTYKEDGEDILKASYWYLMRSEGTNGLKPQVEEDIDEVRWVPARDIENLLPEMYPSIRDVIFSVLS